MEYKVVRISYKTNGTMRIDEFSKFENNEVEYSTVNSFFTFKKAFDFYNEVKQAKLITNTFVFYGITHNNELVLSNLFNSIHIDIFILLNNKYYVKSTNDIQQEVLRLLNPLVKDVETFTVRNNNGLYDVDMLIYTDDECYTYQIKNVFYDELSKIFIVDINKNNFYLT